MGVTVLPSMALVGGLLVEEVCIQRPLRRTFWFVEDLVAHGGLGADRNGWSHADSLANSALCWVV